MSHFFAGSKIVSETINAVWYLSDQKLHSLAEVQTRTSLMAPHMLVAFWNGFASPTPQPPFPLPLTDVPPPPPTFFLSALSSVQLFTFSKVIYFQDNLIMSKPTLLCSVTRQDGPEREGGDCIDWLCLAHFTWRADELYGQQLRNHLVRLS